MKKHSERGEASLKKWWKTGLTKWVMLLQKYWIRTVRNTKMWIQWIVRLSPTQNEHDSKLDEKLFEIMPFILWRTEKVPCLFYFTLYTINETYSCSSGEVFAVINALCNSPRKSITLQSHRKAPHRLKSTSLSDENSDIHWTWQHIAPLLPSLMFLSISTTTPRFRQNFSAMSSSVEALT